MQIINPPVKSFYFLLLAFGSTLVALGQAVNESAVQPATADAEYAAFTEFCGVQPPAKLKGESWHNLYLWLDQQSKAITATGMKFYQTHPADARRWAVVMMMGDNPPYFISGFGPDADNVGPDIDRVAKANWEKNQNALVQALRDSADAPEAQREMVAWNDFAADFRATSGARGKGEPADFSALATRFEAHLAKYAQLDVVADRALDYLGALERQVHGSTAEVWQRLQDGPNAALRVKAKERVAYFDNLSKPVEISFTAADGRAVDLKTLRGKVVLVDFWATWCGPCKAELPNVVANYQKYHDQGFEVVGISLENARLSPQDSPEQRDAKLAQAKKELTDFAAAHDMPWPQYFDGKWWKNDISTRYAIQGIPAMFLLDQEGRIVSTNARGEVLEREVRRLLKL